MMPYLNFKNAGPLTKEEKEKLAAGFTKVVSDVTGKPASATYVVIDEISRENWAVGSELLSNKDKKG